VDIVADLIKFVAPKIRDKASFEIIESTLGTQRCYWHMKYASQSQKSLCPYLFLDLIHGALGYF